MPDEVPTVSIDRVTHEPTDPSDPASVDRSYLLKICIPCARAIGDMREQDGLPDLWGGRWTEP
jgi:hypothetical protein